MVYHLAKKDKEKQTRKMRVRRLEGTWGYERKYEQYFFFILSRYVSCTFFQLYRLYQIRIAYLKMVIERVEVII